MLETISTKNMNKIDVASLCVKERDFIRCLIDKSRSNQIENNASIQSSAPKHSWKIRIKQEELKGWLPNNNSYYPFFDGASKSNPGTAGVGGVIYNPSGSIIATFEWGLGPLSNIRAEALALYQGLNQLQKFGINKAMIFGDSATIISLMVSSRKTCNIFLHQTQ